MDSEQAGQASRVINASGPAGGAQSSRRSGRGDPEKMGEVAVRVTGKAARHCGGMTARVSLSNSSYALVLDAVAGQHFPLAFDDFRIDEPALRPKLAAVHPRQDTLRLARVTAAIVAPTTARSLVGSLGRCGRCPTSLRRESEAVLKPGGHRSERSQRNSIHRRSGAHLESIRSRGSRFGARQASEQRQDRPASALSREPASEIDNDTFLFPHALQVI